MGNVDTIVREIDPKLLCIVYEGYPGYLETHEVRKKVLTGFELGPARPLSIKQANMLRKILGEAERQVKVKGAILSENILYTASNLEEECIIWYRKAGMARIRMKGMDPEDFEVNLPTLIFQYDGSLTVFATTERGRPKNTTKLMILPFRNMGSKGNICMGQNRVTNAADVNDFVLKMEMLFFKSRFTHGEFPLQTWKVAAKTGKFPNDKLKKTGNVLKSLIIG